MSGIRILVSTETKAGLIRQARANGRSLLSEVLVALLHYYRPDGWRAIETNTLIRTKPNRGVRPGLINDGEPEPLFIIMPEVLKGALQVEAQKNFRSLSAEIRRFLVSKYEQKTSQS